jgi:hypothetical protein
MRSTLGRRYGGSSRMKADASPRRMVCDRPHDTISVTTTPKTTTPTTAAVPMREAANVPGVAAAPATNSEATAISVGKRPLHGTKTLVRMAISRSRGESITRQAMTPAALQPNPIIMVSACLP